MSKLSKRIATIALISLGVACGSHISNSAIAQQKEQLKQKGSPAAATAAPVKKWEYRIVVMYDGQDSEDVEKELNKLGEQGFEIVTATSSQRGNGRQSSRIHYTLKRAKQ